MFQSFILTNTFKKICKLLNNFCKYFFALKRIAMIQLFNKRIFNTHNIASTLYVIMLNMPFSYIELSWFLTHFLYHKL